MCCQAVSLQSASNATYTWWVIPDKGEFDPDETNTNFTDFHCYWYASGGVGLYNNIAPGVLEGHGLEDCDVL